MYVLCERLSCEGKQVVPRWRWPDSDTRDEQESRGAGCTLLSTAELCAKHWCTLAIKCVWQEDCAPAVRLPAFRPLTVSNRAVPLHRALLAPGQSQYAAGS